MENYYYLVGFFTFDEGLSGSSPAQEQSGAAIVILDGWIFKAATTSYLVEKTN
eukprot:CAMPEP_0201147770 /NCGR_PEP_ID=MMETSP0851-20130426/9291_1 /ASSEMBLY_ACC=CAM_ASM_000631 /TAXON_ID=183588 /ORGANISM="Pseudo-nitzschia fraudulenta, Strain WWA7" /LENGTH=52 /DNA_ID=CAMNT_0047423711 /DNA_START=528 /DNA_END=686 /DNA_ORIENTATION=-